jgi:Tfp pilus assembly protein PilF
MGMISPFALRYRNVLVNVFYWQWVFSTFQIRALYVGIFYFAMDLITGSGMALMGVQWVVANFAHVGGFVCGIIWALAMRMPAAATLEEARDTAAGYAAAGAHKAAADMLKHAIKRDPTNPELHAKAGEYLSKHPKSASAACAEWSTAFRLWLRREEPETALDNWLLARKTFGPEQFAPAVALQMALLAEKRNLPQEVAEVYSSVAVCHSRCPEAPLAALRLGDMLGKMGHVKQSQQWYEYLTKTWPQSEESLSAQAHLQ